MRSSAITGARILCLALALLGCASPSVLLATSGCDDHLTFLSADDGKVNDKSAAPDGASSLDSSDLSDLAPVSSLPGSTVGGSWNPSSQKAHNAYGRLPISFERNDRQTDPRVRFLSRNSGYNLFLTDDEAVLSMQGDAHKTSDNNGAGSSVRSRHESAIDVLRMKLLGASRRARSSGVDQLPGKTNYILGGNQKDWRRNVPTYGKVKFEAVYPGIDLLYYGNQRQIEYDFVLSPGADPNRIKLGFRGATNIRVDANGDLVLRLASRESRQLAANAYQEIKGVKRSVKCRYVVSNNNRVHFKIGGYDRSRTLVIDPVVSYSTYLGGASVDAGYSIAVGTESSGSYAYITGLTRSLDFPTTSGAYQRTFVGSQNDVFVTKLNQDGTGLVYSTYIGGDNNDIGYSIAVNGSGQAFVAGATESSNFPTTPGAYQETLPGVRSAFLVKLQSSGDGLVFSTFLGGQLDQEAYGIALNGSNAYVAGWTASSDFPTTPGAFQSFCNSGANCDNGFVTRFDSTGGALVYSTYLGVFEHCRINGIAVDSAGSAYVTGFGSGSQSQDGFVAKLSPTGLWALYISILGGDDVDACNAIAVDSAGNAYVTGQTKSINYPSTFHEHAFGMRLGDNAFVTKVGSLGEVLYSKFLEGDGDDRGRAIAIDADGGAYVAGSTTSLNFPVSADALQSHLEGGAADVFLTKLSPSGETLLYSTYWGGASEDSGNGVALDAVNDVYATGITYSADLPATTGAFQSSPVGTSDAFVLKIGMAQQGFAVNGQVTNNLNNPLNGVAVSVSGPFSRKVHTDSAGNYSIGGLAAGGSFTVSAQRGSFVFSPSSFEFPSLAQNETLDFTGPAPLAISGTIKDSRGNPASASVTISGSASATVQTDEFGRYVFNDLAQGDYTVTPSHPLYTFSPASASVTGLSGDRVFDFTKSTLTISGQITDENGNGVNATVALSGDSNQTVETDAQGRYWFYDNPTGRNYTVTPSSSYYTFTPASQSVSNAISDQTFNFTALPPLSIYGRVTNEWGFGVEGVTLTLSCGINDTRVTDSNGDYSFANIPARLNYTVTPSKAHYSFSPASANVNDLSANSVVDFAATLLTHSISGRVVDGKGSGLAGVSVSLTGSQPGSATTDENGNFTFLSLPGGGSYTVTPSLAFYAFAPDGQTFNDLGASQTANFTGARLTYNITGRVMEDAVGVAGATIALSGAQSGSAVTDALGNYSFAGLPAGYDYNLTASSPYFVFSPASWTVVSLNGNQIANFAAARLTHQINGEVQDACARPIAGVTMTLTHDGISAMATTDSSGQYSFSGAPAGYNYSLRPTKTGYAFDPVSASYANLTSNQAANFTGTPATTSANLAPTADSYVRGASGANTNFGSATELITRLANGANNTMETYLTFNVGQPCTVSSVKLELFGGLSGKPDNVQVSAYAVSNTTWTETGLTWNNKPPAGSLLRTTTVVNSTAGWYEWDITSYVQSEIAAGRGVISIVLRNPTTTPNQVIFNSREATTNKPKLVVVTP